MAGRAAQEIAGISKASTDCLREERPRNAGSRVANLSASQLIETLHRGHASPISRLQVVCDSILSDRQGSSFSRRSEARGVQ